MSKTNFQILMEELESYQDIGEGSNVVAGFQPTKEVLGTVFTFVEAIKLFLVSV